MSDLQVCTGYLITKLLFMPYSRKITRLLVWSLVFLYLKYWPVKPPHVVLYYIVKKIYIYIYITNTHFLYKKTFVIIRNVDLPKLIIKNDIIITMINRE